MAPPSPSIQTLLSSLRSPIFQTAHNPQNLRTGSKYLRKRLVGPSAIQYYPKQLKLRTLNADVAWNRYAGWQGDKIGLLKPESESDSQDTALEAEGEGRVKLANQGKMLPRGEHVPAGFSEVTRIRGAGWVDDVRERTRREEVEIMRAMGRGPPKKGQGKRSQMKKR